MGVKSIERAVGYSVADKPRKAIDLEGADELHVFETDLEDGSAAIWPRGEMDSDDLPPAPGRCRRVPHDW